MSKRKQAQREERRRQAVEVNLLAPTQGRRDRAARRRGCTFPFLGGTLFVITFTVLLHNV